MAITSTESFLALLEKSQLLGAKDLAKVQAAAGKYEDAKALAKALIAAKGLTRWQAGQLLAGRSSFTLGKYRLVDLLGRGGMGSVFAAEHKTLGRRVALKIISKQTGRDPERLERFLDEARRIAALDHPNIVRAFDVDHEGERYFLVLERIEGRDLQQIVEKDGPLDVDRAANFTRQAALGLAHAHDRKMIHCDIKPANLIVGDDNAVKILDMGMARLVERDGSTSDSDESIVGTIDYIAPEQALEADDLDHRVDIYSLGCTLYFLLTSHTPFGEGTLAQRIMKHQTQAPKPIAEIRPGVPDELVDVCLKMMAKKPEDRFQDATEVAQALEAWSNGEAAPAAVKPTKVAKNTKAAASGPAAVELIGDEAAEGDGEEEEVTISITDSGSLTARAESKAGRRPTTVRKVDEEEEVEAEPALLEPAGFFDDPRKKWATIIGAGLLLLAGAGGGMAWMMGGGKATPSDPAEDTVASAEPVPTTPAAPVSESGLDLGDDLDLDDTFGGITRSRAESKPAPAASDTETAAKPEAEGATEMKADAPAAGEEKPKASEPADPMEEAPKKEEPKKEEPKKEPVAKKEEPKKEEPKKPAPKPAPKVEPFKGFPKTVSLPVLVDNDPIGEASRAPVTLAAIRGPATANWQMLLVGGEAVIKGDRKYTLSRTEVDAAKASWDVELEDISDGEREKIARVWRQAENLRFQWADGASGTSANYLRNCFLQVRVSGESRYVALTTPVKAEPILLDLQRGQGNANVALKWAPNNELLRFKFEGIDGIKKVLFDPAEPVPPKTQVAMHIVYTDRHQNDTNAVTYRLLPTARKTSLALDMRLMSPQSREFKSIIGNANDQQVGVMIDQMGNKRSDLQRKMRDLKGGEAEKKNREYDIMSLQMWYLEFYLLANKKLSLQYQVVADVGGQELVLVSTR